MTEALYSNIQKEIKMVKSVSVGLICIFLLASNALAGLYSYQHRSDSGTVVVATTIKEKGIYNLIISAQFLRKPNDQKVFKSDAYSKLIDRLLVEWRGIAIQKVLEAKELTVYDTKNSDKTI